MSDETTIMDDDIPTATAAATQSRYPLEECLARAQTEAANESRRLSGKVYEFQKESERLRRESRQLLDEADQVDSQMEMIRKDEESAQRLDSTLSFEMVLLRLKRNDPTLVEIDTLQDFYYPPGYGRDLGEALQRSTFVSKLCLSLGSLLSSESETLDATWIAPMAEFVATSPCLRHLCLSMDGEEETDVTSSIIDCLFEAIPTNCAIETLACDIPVPATSFCYMMNRAKSLKTLEINFLPTKRGRYSQRDEARIASMFGSHKTLEALKLCVEENENVAVLILESLQESRSRLRELTVRHSICCGDRYNTALFEFVGSTSKLQHLDLSFFTFHNVVIMEHVIHLLQQQDDTTTLPSRLSLSECCGFGKEAVDRLAAYLQTRLKGNDGVIARNPLLELHISMAGWQPMGRYVSRQLASCILMKVPITAHDDGVLLLLPTFGSQLRSLSLDNVHGIFLRRLTANAHRVRLERLQLGLIGKSVGIALSKCIPCLVSLRELVLAEVDPSSTRMIVRGLKKNGTLRLVSTTNENRETNFSTAELRLIEAYCQRNEHMALFLENEAQQDTDDHGLDSTKMGNVEASLFPSLLEVAKQVPRMRATVLTRALLLLGGSEEPSLKE
jgi:hypothetical protein